MQTLTNQQFTYRQTPAVQDGVGRLDSIKGNTVKFNQLVQNGNFASTDNWRAINSNISVSGNVCSQTMTGAEWSQQIAQDNFQVIANHKYYVCATIKTPSVSDGAMMRFYSANADARSRLFNTQANVFTKIRDIIAPVTSYTASLLIYPQFQTTAHPHGFEVGAIVEYKNVMISDLTALGIDNLTTTDEVEAWLSSHIGNLPYYSYTQGKLLPFKGEELKTTGKNQLPLTLAILKSLNSGTWNDNVFTIRGVNFTVNTNSDGYITEIIVNGTATGGNANLQLIPTGFSFLANAIMNGCPNGGSGTTYYIRCGANVYGSMVYYNDYGLGANIPQNVENMWIGIYNGVQVSNIVFKPMVRLADVQDATFEPYTSSTINLPTLNYFPSGMKSAGTVYDELTESKAITRVGQVVLDGTQTVIASNFDSDTCRMFISIPNIQGKTSSQDEVDTDVISSYLLPISNNLSNYGTAGIHRRAGGQQQLCVSLGVSAYTSGITTEALFNQYLSEHPLTVYYPLATPTEEPIDADLIFNGVQVGGTEQILPENTSVPITAPILADMSYSSGYIDVITHPNPIPGGETSGDGRYLIGDNATINAVPNEHYVFKNWELDNEVVSTDPEYTFEVSDE